MRLVTYRHDAHGSTWQAGVLQGDRVLNAGLLLDASPQLSMLALLEQGPGAQSRLNKAADRFAGEHQAAIFVPREVAVPAWEAELAAPVPNPPSLRDFYAFEQHVAAGYRKRGRDVPAAWYEAPVFYFGYNGNLFGPDQPVPKPAETAELDFELELAAVIGLAGRDIAAADAWDHVAGFTVMNDWSARDVQRQEMAVGLGPAKGKDFATSLGPVMLTIDEIRDRIDGESIDLAMIVRVNGEELARDTSASMHFGFPRLIERASRHAELRPGDVIGSGTCGGGCLLELGPEVHPWLEPGDEVELEIERIGRLRSAIG